MNKINLYIRSAIFAVAMWAATMIQSLICILLWPLPLSIRFRSVSSYTYAVIWMLKIICRIDYKVEGLENLPKDHKCVVLSKHQSTWETFFLASFLYEPAIIAKKELLWVPFFGWGLATISPITINRSKMSSAMEQIIKKGKAFLEAGRNILVFPEGTRIPYGKIGKYRLGGARLAVAAGVPVIPVAHNAGRFWPRRRFIKIPGTVHIIFGPPIETKNKTSDEVTQQTQRWIEDTIAKL